MGTPDVTGEAPRLPPPGSDPHRSASADDTCLEQGRDAASRADWPRAFALLREADTVRPTHGEDLALLGEVAYAAGHLDQAIEAWERAHAENVRAGDRMGAARAATRVAMHLLFDTALTAPVRGWLKRAEQLLEDQEPTAVHAWLAVIRNYERMLSGDFAEARRWARRAIELGARCDPGAAAIGRIAEARSLILEGEVGEGLDLLNEAAVATVSGELDPLSTGIVYCELVCALQGLAQYDLAEEWTRAMELWARTGSIGSLHGRCRVHRAEILRLRGFNREAEEEALLACEELRPYMRRELGWPLTELGQIRLRRGDLEGAEQAFLAAHEAGWDPQPGLALTYLARGDVDLAAATIRHALEHPSQVPSKEVPPSTELRRAPLLEAQVEIAAAAGDVDGARQAAAELAQIATVFGSKAFVASAATAAGRVRLMLGDAPGARLHFETATALWTEIGAPYEIALGRLQIGEVLRSAGDVAGARLELHSARSIFEQIGATLQADRASRAHASSGPGSPGAKAAGDAPASTAPASPPSGAPAPQVCTFQREGEYWSVAFEGRATRLRDLKGMRYLARLFAEPGREFHVLDLVAAERGWLGDGDGTEPAERSAALNDAGEHLDAQARGAYRRRLAEIEEDIEEARALGHIERESQAEAERQFLIRELSRAVGLGGRGRRAGSASERARASVTRALRSARTRIGEHIPTLGEHLDQRVRTGTYCVYLADTRTRIAWKL